MEQAFRPAYSTPNYIVIPSEAFYAEPRDLGFFIVR